jgi:predicted nucleotidyltransferase
MIEAKDQEQIIRTAKPFGNGAHVFVPKEWIGEQIVIIKPKKASLRERVLYVLDKYLDSIIGVYLYGSYARDEQTPESDIDLLVITDKKINIKSEGFEILSIGEDKFGKAIKIQPILMYSILSEGKPIINSKLFESLKSKYKIKISDFRDFFEDTKRIIKVNEEFLLDEKSLYLKSEAVIYSLVLRLRGLFLIKSLLKDKKYSNKSFVSWIKSELSEIDFDSIYSAYRLSKMDLPIKEKIKISDIRLLIEFLKKGVYNLQYG